MSEIEHKAELYFEVPVDFSPLPVEDAPQVGYMPSIRYREAAEGLLVALGYRHAYQTTTTQLSREQKGRLAAQEMATIDSLTGLRNRRTFDDFFFDACEKSVLENTTVGVFILDVDGQKRVNDDKERCGTGTGDHLLQLVANRLMTLMRYGDQAFRYGGDEFVVVAPDFTADMPDYDYDAKLARLHRIRDRFESTINHAIKSRAIPTDGDEYIIPEDLHVGISVGCAMLRPGEAPEVLFKRADENLGYRKQERREELIARGVLFADERTIVDYKP